MLAQFDNPCWHWSSMAWGQGAGCRLRRAIVQAIRPLLAISSEPLVSSKGTDAGSVSGLFNAQALLKDTLDKKQSTKDG